MWNAQKNTLNSKMYYLVKTPTLLELLPAANSHKKLYFYLKKNITGVNTEYFLKNNKIR